MAEKRRIDVTTSPNGYTVFSIAGENIVGYQCLAGTHHLIPRERESFSTRSGRVATERLQQILLAEGGDVDELCCRSQMPLGE